MGSPSPYPARVAWEEANVARSNALLASQDHARRAFQQMLQNCATGPVGGTAPFPLVRVRAIIHQDDSVRSLSCDLAQLVGKMCEIFVTELTVRAWVNADFHGRRTIQREDLVDVIRRVPALDFLRPQLDTSRPPERGKKGSSREDYEGAAASADDWAVDPNLARYRRDTTIHKHHHHQVSNENARSGASAVLGAGLDRSIATAGQEQLVDSSGGIGSPIITSKVKKTRGRRRGRPAAKPTMTLSKTTTTTTTTTTTATATTTTAATTTTTQQLQQQQQQHPQHPQQQHPQQIRIVSSNPGAYHHTPMKRQAGDDEDNLRTAICSSTSTAASSSAPMSSTTTGGSSDSGTPLPSSASNRSSGSSSNHTRTSMHPLVRPNPSHHTHSLGESETPNTARTHSTSGVSDHEDLLLLATTPQQQQQQQQQQLERYSAERGADTPLAAAHPQMTQPPRKRQATGAASRTSH